MLWKIIEIEINCKCVSDLLAAPKKELSFGGYVLSPMKEQFDCPLDLWLNCLYIVRESENLGAIW